MLSLVLLVLLFVLLLGSLPSWPYSRGWGYYPSGTLGTLLLIVLVLVLLDKVWTEACMSKTIGFVLIVLGLIGIAWGGFTFTTKEKVVDLGPIEATRDKKHTVPLPPIAGVVALVGGIALVATGKK
jgi:hypothetical protein